MTLLSKWFSRPLTGPGYRDAKQAGKIALNRGFGEHKAMKNTAILPKIGHMSFF